MLQQIAKYKLTYRQGFHVSWLLHVPEHQERLAPIAVLGLLLLGELGAHLQVPLHPDTVWPSYSQHLLAILNAGRVINGRAVFGLNIINETGHLVITRDKMHTRGSWHY